MIALGLCVKSGAAIAVALSGTRAAPVFVLRQEVLLCDPEVAASRQPYHDGFGTAQDDAKVIARLTGIIKRCAARSCAELLAAIETEPVGGAGARRAGVRQSATASADDSAEPIRACLVVGSIIDPEKIANPHIRAHAHEGRLFRTVLLDAFRAHRVEPIVIVGRKLAPAASRELGPPSRLRRTLARLGAGRHPWRTEEKSAALAAWMLLPRAS
jgi:hypothetical protein